MQERHVMSRYFAPRGAKRMYRLGMQLMQLYLSPSDKIIGIIGEAGSGKSALIRGMFPGLELTNDDNGVYVRPLPLLDIGGFSMFEAHTYHLDIRFENGFTQMSELASAIRYAVKQGKRVVVEHFDLVYPLLDDMNADLLIGVGEEVVITRPTIFGPEPEDIKRIVYRSLPYRLQSHTAEDLCEMFLSKEDLERCDHEDVMHGFVISFRDYPPAVDLVEMEQKIKEMIAQDLPVSYKDERHVSIGDRIHPCTGPRIHVSRTSQIEGFRLLKQFIYDEVNRKYLLVGIVGEDNAAKIKSLEKRLKLQKPLM